MSLALVPRPTIFWTACPVVTLGWPVVCGMYPSGLPE
jgi:hypothetical protein